MIEYRKVSIDGSYEADAWVDDSRDWNGWALPYFPFDEAQHVLDESTESEYSSVSGYRYDEDEDAFYVTDDDLSGEAIYEGVPIFNESGDQVGIGYPIGAGEWIWDYSD